MVQTGVPRAGASSQSSLMAPDRAEPGAISGIDECVLQSVAKVLGGAVSILDSKVNGLDAPA